MLIDTRSASLRVWDISLDAKGVLNLTLPPHSVNPTDEPKVLTQPELGEQWDDQDATYYRSMVQIAEGFIVRDSAIRVFLMANHQHLGLMAGEKVPAVSYVGFKTDDMIAVDDMVNILENASQHAKFLIADSTDSRDPRQIYYCHFNGVK